MPAAPPARRLVQKQGRGAGGSRGSEDEVAPEVLAADVVRIGDELLDVGTPNLPVGHPLVEASINSGWVVTGSSANSGEPDSRGGTTPDSHGEWFPRELHQF